MRKSSRRSAKVFHEKDATLIAEKVCLLKQLVGGWWEEKVDLTPCNGATPSESRIRGIRTYGSMRGRRSSSSVYYSATLVIIKFAYIVNLIGLVQVFGYS
jgi:hypothetical protein